MATGRKDDKQRQGRLAAPLPDPVEDDLDLAEEIIHSSREEYAAVVAESKKFLKALGLEGKNPIGAKKLRERMLQEGFDPESNEFSRGIIEMREE
jgi:hypothetical protein